MAGSIALLAALPREIKGLVGATEPDPELARSGVVLYRVPGGVVVAAGMGATRVSLAFEAARLSGNLTQVISTGLAGACTPAVRPGSVVEAARVIDIRTGERFSTVLGESNVVLASTDAIASVAEKTRLQAAYGAALVDMEAATVARLARAHGLAFRAIKGISDAHDFELASLARFADAKGQFRTAAFALHTALHPREWKSATTLGRHSTAALRALTMRLQEILASAT